MLFGFGVSCFWIPAFAGMTWSVAGMTWSVAGMMWCVAGMTMWYVEITIEYRNSNSMQK